MKVEDSKVSETDYYLLGILEGDSRVLNEFYANYFERIAAFIIKNSGDINDAKDVFQDAIMIIYQKAKKTDFELKSTLSAYFYGVCKNIWLQKLRKQKRIVPLSIEGNQIENDSTIEKDIEERNKQQLFFSKFSLLKEGCQQILKLFFAKKSMKEIAQKLGLGSEGYAKKRKYECQKKLLELVKEDNIYKELYN